MSWDTQLVTASFRGVEFDVERTADSFERRLHEHEYYGRDGADLEDMGRKARRTQLTAVFLGPEYEGDLGALLKVIDEGTAGTFWHPILGSWQARLERAEVEHGHERRDAATVQITVIADGTGKLPELAVELSVDGLIAEVQDITDDVLAADTNSVPAVSSAVDAALDFAAEVKSNIVTAVDAVNQVRKRIDSAMEAIKTATDFENYALVKSLRRLTYSCSKLASRVQKLRPKVLAQEVSASLPLPLLAHTLYGDRSRADQLALLNPIRNPFDIPAGMSLKVYSS